ncbi:MAG: LysR substrate-binding domain-containing protein [Emergencia sp.]
MMEIRVLRYFLTVVREGSITKAADVLHITQPTLSRQLAQMEVDMGVKLFDRGTRKIVLTNEGLLLERRAEEILALVDKTEKELIEQDENIEGTVSIGCGDLRAVQLLTEFMGRFHEMFPDVSFELYTANADHISEQMERGLIDIGILLEPINMEKFDFIRLKQKEQWVVVMPPDSPLAKQESVTASDLVHVPLILPCRLSVRSELASWFGDVFDKLNVPYASNLPANSSLMVYNKLAYAIIVSGSLSLWDSEKIVCRPLYPELTASSVVAWKRKQPFGLAASKFIEYIKKEISALE